MKEVEFLAVVQSSTILGPPLLSSSCLSAPVNASLFSMHACKQASKHMHRHVHMRGQQMPASVFLCVMLVL